MAYTSYSHSDLDLSTLATDGPTGVQALRARWRAWVLPALDGDVLDVGAGDGSGLTHLPRAARVALLEPHRASAERLDRQAARLPGSRVLHAAAEQIPLASGSVDSVVCNSVLCSVADQDRALAEIGRVLRPGGRLVVLEHVAAGPGTGVRRAQRLLTPVSRLVDRGCDLARDTEAALVRSGLAVDELHRLDALGPWGLRIPHVAAVLSKPAPSA